jgi:hypothetical protein
MDSNIKNLMLPSFRDSGSPRTLVMTKPYFTQQASKVFGPSLSKPHQSPSVKLTAEQVVAGKKILHFLKVCRSMRKAYTL